MCPWLWSTYAHDVELEMKLKECRLSEQVFVKSAKDYKGRTTELGKKGQGDPSRIFAYSSSNPVQEVG